MWGATGGDGQVWEVHTMASQSPGSPGLCERPHHGQKQTSPTEAEVPEPFLSRMKGGQVGGRAKSRHMASVEQGLCRGPGGY